MATTKRVSLTLPVNIVDDLDYVSRALQVTRSSLVSEFLVSVTEVRRIVELSIAATTNDDNDDNAVTLARDPEKVRSYLASISQAIDSNKADFDRECESFVSTIEGLKNEH